MERPTGARVHPLPTDEEAAAIAAALAAYLAERRAAQPAPTPPERRWALAGRLASQGQDFARPRGGRVGWGNVSRVRRGGG